LDQQTGMTAVGAATPWFLLRGERPFAHDPLAASAGGG